MHTNTLETLPSSDLWQPVLCPNCGAHVLLADGGIWQCQNAHCGARWLDKAPDAERGLLGALPAGAAPVAEIRYDHVTINQPRLTERNVHIHTGSTVELVKSDGYDDSYWSLLVDGRYYPLVMVKFIYGRPEIEVSLQNALTQVQQAIAALNAPAADVNGDSSPLTTAQTLAQSLANITRVPTHVVAQNGAYLVQDETDIDCYGGRAAIVATYAPPAQTRQSQAIEQTQRRCHNCGADHRTWQCPEVGDAFAPPVYATDELVRLWGASRALLVAKLARLTPGQLTSQAIAFAAWLNEQTHAALSARSVLRVWEELINDRGPAGAALPRAA